MHTSARSFAGGAAAIAVGAALALSGCAGPSTVPPSSATPSPTPSLTAVVRPGTPVASDATSDDVAQKLLDAAPIPTTAKSYSAMPAGAPSQPATLSACTPIADKTKFWMTGDELSTVQAWLTANPGPGMRVSGTMSGPGEEASVTESPVAAPADVMSSELEYSFVRLANSTLVRVDALVVPLGAACASSGGGAVGGANGPAVGGASGG